MDRVLVFGTSDGGSIPSGRTFKIRVCSLASIRVEAGQLVERSRLVGIGRMNLSIYRYNSQAHYLQPGFVAQLVERSPLKRLVAGSSPAGPTPGH